MLVPIIIGGVVVWALLKGDKKGGSATASTHVTTPGSKLDGTRASEGPQVGGSRLDPIDEDLITVLDPDTGEVTDPARREPNLRMVAPTDTAPTKTRFETDFSIPAGTTAPVVATDGLSDSPVVRSDRLRYATGSYLSGLKF